MSRARPGWGWLAAIAAALGLQSALAQGGAPAPEPAPFIVGIGRSIHDGDGAAAAMSELGIQSMRLDAPWSSIETAPGNYGVPAWLEAAVDSAKARGIEPLLILAYGHPLYGGDKPRTAAAIAAFSRYAVFVTTHFAGRVRYFDLWNEWDAATGKTTPGTPDDYVALAQRVYPAIKAANADAVVLSGGISTLGPEQHWLERFVELGGLQFVDGLSLHPYNFQKRGAATPEAAIAELDRIHALTETAGHGGLPIYVTEIGYPAFDGRGGVSRELAATYVARFLLLASTRPYVAGAWWYCLRDQGNDGNNKEHNFGVLDSTWRPKPAAETLRAVAALLAEVKRFRVDGAEGHERLLASHANGAEIVLAWTEAEPDGPTLRTLELATAAADRPRR